MVKKYLEISDEVKNALKANQPIVALESTIISHGMPYPKNVETAKAVEAVVREYGAVPATIAIINGKLKVGLSAEEIEFLGQSKEIKKVSRRDLPMVVAQKMHGATTVAATMIIAALANIKVFATGGIGGVHRDGQNTFDISADLEELSRTNVAVVCAGPKSILDINLTLEYLETKGVPVFGYKTSKLPAFYHSNSEFDVDYKVDRSEEIARALKVKWELGLSGGVVIANPIEKEYEMDKKVIDQAIQDALAESEALGLKGKEITPFLLDKIKDITKGDSLESNIHLVFNNARLAANIARDLSLENKKI